MYHFGKQFIGQTKKPNIKNKTNKTKQKLVYNYIIHKMFNRTNDVSFW